MSPVQPLGPASDTRGDTQPRSGVASFAAPSTSRSPEGAPAPDQASASDAFRARIERLIAAGPDGSIATRVRAGGTMLDATDGVDPAATATNERIDAESRDAAEASANAGSAARQRVDAEHADQNASLAGAAPLSASDEIAGRITKKAAMSTGANAPQREDAKSHAPSVSAESRATGRPSVTGSGDGSNAPRDTGQASGAQTRAQHVETAARPVRTNDAAGAPNAPAAQGQTGRAQIASAGSATGSATGQAAAASTSVAGSSPGSQAIASQGLGGKEALARLESLGTASRGNTAENAGTRAPQRSMIENRGLSLEADRTINQVSKGLAEVMLQGGGSLSMRLRPDTLGAVRVDITINNGVVDASVTASTDVARSLLDSHSAELRDALAQRGLEVARITVTRDAGDTTPKGQERPEGHTGGDTPGRDAGHPGQDEPGGRDENRDRSRMDGSHHEDARGGDRGQQHRAERDAIDGAGAPDIDDGSSEGRSPGMDPGAEHHASVEDGMLRSLGARAEIRLNLFV
ncbi:MAG: flagellar hook-length control protein FliK [Planctomycetota bacterium]